MNYIHFIGIDISKNFFDVVCLEAEAVGEAKDRPHRAQKFANNPKGFAAFLQAYARALPQALVVMESTGGYENALIATLLQAKVAVHRADPLTAKHFIRSLGKRAKTDALDALALARYGLDRHADLRTVQPSDQAQQELTALLARRGDLLTFRVAEQQRQKHPGYSKTADSVAAMLTHLSEQISRIEARIHALIEGSCELTHKMAVMTSVKGIGVQTAATLIGFMPELGTLTRRQAASLAGCAPHPRDSGNNKGYRRTCGGRSAIKRALFMAAMSARQFNPKLKEFYENLIKNGKKPIVAITAIMRKLITILNAKLRDANLQTSW
jgi:transposase